jgi:hypothetical protein
MMEL